jgi:hypothetical protein
MPNSKNRSAYQSFSATITSRPFAVAIFLLLLNDLLLKHLLHNAFTGKLSDFAGLFAFALFFGSMLPKHSKSVIAGIGAAFIFWKSPLASGCIDLFNSVAPFSIARVVDYTDILALIVLPFANLELHRPKSARVDRSMRTQLATVFSCAVALFAFCATSMTHHNEDFDHAYYFSLGKEALLNTFTQKSIEVTKSDTNDFHCVVGYVYSTEGYARDPDSVFLEAACLIRSEYGNQGAHSVLILKRLLTSSRPEQTREGMLANFEAEVIAKIPGKLSDNVRWHFPRLELEFLGAPILIALFIGEILLLIPAIVLLRSRRKPLKASEKSRTAKVVTWITWITTASWTLLLVGMLIHMARIVD